MNAHLPRTLILGVITAALAACGGGEGTGSGSGGGFSGTTSDETAQSTSANGVVAADEGVRAQAAVLAAARTVMGQSGASGALGCAGGGTAVFTATAGNSGSLFNGVPDPGETYRIVFNDCHSSSNSAVLDGTLTLNVLSASGENLSVSTTSQLEVALPNRTLTFNGNSTFSHAVQTSSSPAGAVQVVTDHWASPSISVASRRNGRTTVLSLTNVDLTHTVSTTGGNVTSTTNEGSVTMNYLGLLGSWSATISTQGAVAFDVNGVPLSGGWLITLPNDRIELRIVAGVATALIDFGRNNTVDRTLTWLVPALIVGAD